MCGIIGVFGSERAAQMAALGLFAEQHRGQESCGMAVSDGTVIRLRKQMGLVKEVFSDDCLHELPGQIAIGHVRYPTKGSATEFNTQPHLVETLSGPTYALASNGDLVNYNLIRKQLEDEKVYFKSDNDGELLVKYLAYRIIRHGDEIAEAIRHLMRDVKGAYSCVLCTRTELYMFRDPHSIRPMVWGMAPNGVAVVASESCALDTLDVVNRHEVPPAGIVKISKSTPDAAANEILIIENDPNLYRTGSNEKHCIFEHIYFSRPDSYHFGEDVYRVRENIGAAMAEDDIGLNPDLIVPVPDSSNFIGIGYANASKVPLSLGLIRNHYVGRTFIKPEQTIRDESVRQKFNVLPNFFKGKKIVLIDDSIVRGTTIGKIVKLIKDAGAAEIHLRIGSPQVRHSCYYGIDTPNAKELVANCYSLEEIRTRIGVDSLKHLSMDDLRKCVLKPNNYCYACFNGEYPLGVPQ
ncbi:MAG: amidophosphoribosyltransferase [Candidatus Cloacimonetes bacterium]|nr:amidophosphoribosyltransferase [Candidatus Cloacimonadota bacterium]